MLPHPACAYIRLQLSIWTGRGCCIFHPATRKLDDAYSAVVSTLLIGVSVSDRSAWYISWLKFQDLCREVCAKYAVLDQSLCTAKPGRRTKRSCSGDCSGTRPSRHRRATVIVHDPSLRSFWNKWSFFLPRTSFHEFFGQNPGRNDCI